MWKHIAVCFLLLLTSCSNDDSINPVTEKPALTNAGEVVYTKGITIDTSLEIANIGGAAVFCTATNMPANLQVRAANDTCQISGTPDATTDSSGQIVTIVAFNALGISVADVTIRINVQLKPNLKNLPKQVFKVNSPVQNTVFDNDGGVFLTGCDVSPDMPSGLEIAVTDDGNSCQIIGTPTVEQLIAKNYTITATNATGSNTATVLQTIHSDEWQQDNSSSDVITPTEPANLSSPAAQVFIKGVIIPVVKFSNTGGDVVSCEVSPQLPEGLQIVVAIIADTATCLMIGTAAQLQATTTHTVTASNSGGASSAAISITVNDDTQDLNSDIPELNGDATELISPSRQIFTINTAIPAVNFSNIGGDVDTCEVSPQLPEGLQIVVAIIAYTATCLMIGTAAQLQATTTHTVTASNSGGTSNAEISITVNDDTPELNGHIPELNDDTPELVSPSHQLFTINTAIPAVKFSNIGGDVVTCEVSPQLPEGLQIVVAIIADTATCLMIGTAAQLQATTTHTVTASNSGGASSAAISITVNDDTPELNGDIPELTGDILELNGDITELNGDIPELNGDVPELSGGSPELIADIPELNSDTPELNTDIPELNYDTPELNTDIPELSGGSPELTANIPELASPILEPFTINTAIAAVNFGNTGGAVTSCEVGGDNSAAWPDGLTLKKTPDGASCQITGTPTALHEEEATYTITASNSGGTSSADISITVNDNIPALVSPSPQHYTIDTAIPTVNFSNTGGAVTSCEVGGDNSAAWPDGLTLKKTPDGASCQITGTPTALHEEEATYTITATNSGGTSSADISITVNDNIPELATPSPRIYTINTPIAAVDFGNAGGAVTSCEVGGDNSAAWPDGLTLKKTTDGASCQITGTPTALHEEEATYTITATNSGGTSSADISITVNDNIPALVSPSPQHYTIDTAIPTVNFSNTGGAVTSCEVGGDNSAAWPDGLTLKKTPDGASCQITGTPTALHEEEATYTITASNSGGDSSADISITVNDNIPALATPSPRIYTINTAIAAVDFGNAGGAVTSCGVVPPLVGGLQLATIADPATCQLTGIPTTLQEDAITYTITATNSGGTSSADISITVNDNIPALATPSPRIYTINTPIAAVDFGNAGGAVTSCGVVPQLVGGLQLATIADPATCQLTGIPTTLQEDAITYTITATNSGGTSSADISITVNDNIPELVNPSPRIYTINTPIAAVDFGNTGGAVTSCGVAPPLVGGLQLATIADPATCQLTGIPTALQEEPITYTITATNSGGTSRAAISITVNDNIPALATPSPRIYTINTAIAAVDFGNTGGAVTSCDVAPQLIGGLQLAVATIVDDTATCQLTGMPTALQEDAITYTITATNSGGTSSADISITVNDNIPELVNPSPRIYTINTPIAAVDFGNAGGAVTSCGVVPPLIGGLQLATIADPATCQLTGIPTTLQEDAITYTITATNSGGTSSADISITVNDNIPELATPSPRIYTINTPIAAVDFGNTGGAVTSCGVSAPLPSDLQLATIADPATCQLTGTPTVLQEEPITYTITATNSGGTSSADISITVNDNIPALATPSPRIYTINTPIAAVDFGNAGGAVTSCGVSAPLPSDLQLATIADPATCQLTGTPTVLQEDPITYTITATNSGGTSRAAISITVNDNIPALVNPSPRIYTINTPIAAVDFGNTGGAVTSCGVAPPLVGGLQLATIADPATCQLTGIPTALQEEPITYTITATNSGGTSSADISITVNDNIPELATPSPRIYTINTAIAAVDFGNAGGAVTSCGVVPPLVGGLQLATIADPATCQLTGIPTALHEEEATYTITASNSGGTSSADISITVNDNIPALVNPSPRIYTINTPIAAVDFGNTGGAVTSCEVGGDNSAAWPDGLTLKKTTAGASCQITGTPTALHEEEATYTITASNSGGTSRAAISITVNDNIPALVSPSPQHYTIDTAIPTVNFSNTGGAVTSCEVGGDNSAAWPDGLTLKKTPDGASCQITGTPTALHEEEATYTITASNSGGTSSADISITVNDNIPALATPSPQHYTIDTAIPTVNFSNTGGAVTSCEVGGDNSAAWPDGLTLKKTPDGASCQITGTPTALHEEEATYTITATNSGGTSSADISITVNDNIPALVSPSPQHYTIDTAIPTVDFGNTGGAVTSCEVGGDNSAAWPDGLTLKKTPDGASCQITGTPTALHEEEATYTITASNSGGTSSAAISITVNDNIPALVSPSPQHYTIDTAIAAVDFGNTGGAVTSCGVVPPLVGGLQLATIADPATCQLTGMPTALQEEPITYTITATNSGGTSNAAITITVNDNIPELVNPSPRIYTINTPIAAVDFGNAGGAVTSCGVVPPLVGGLQLATIADPATCQLTGTPTVLQEEPITYTITATNSGGTSSAAISITVNDNIPELVNPSPRIYTINTPIAAVDFGNTGGAVTSCGVVPPLVGGLQLATIADPATCQLTGIPTTLQEDAITYTITATNSGGTSSADISITVNDNIPELVNPSPRIYTINTPIAAVDFGNTGGAVTSCEVGGDNSAAWPDGLTLKKTPDGASCQITGTPTALHEEEATYTITATNSGGTSSADISITVNDNIPALATPSPRIYTINTPIAAVDFGNTGGAVTSCEVGGDNSAAWPDGLTLKKTPDGASCQITGTPTALHEEEATYTITASNSGGTSNADISITVNDNIPALVSPSPQHYTIDTAIAAVDFGNTGGAVTSCEVGGDNSAAWPDGLTLKKTPDGASCQITGTPTALHEEEATYTITASNSGGDSSADISITVNDNIPALVSPSPQHYTIDTAIAAVDFGNTGGAVTSCEVGGDNSAAWPDGLTLKKTTDGASCQITGTPTALHEEEATYTITATNSGGTSSADISITVNDNIPALVSPSPQHYTIDTAIAAVDFGNTGGAVTSCEVGGDNSAAWPDGLTLKKTPDGASCQLTGTPTALQEEPITYTITATNSGGTSRAAISITVNDNIPALVNPSPRIYTINTPIAAVDFGNAGGAVTSCDVAPQLIGGLQLATIADPATCQLTGIPTTLQEDPITYTITATNSGGDSSADISITVNDNIPALVNPSPRIYTINTAIAAVDFGNTGGAVTSCGVAPPLVGGLQLATIADPATCQLTGIPTALQEEPITYTITATNSGGTSRAAISITVNDNIPELVNPNPRIYTINTPIAAVDFGNTGGAVTSCGVAPPLVGGLQLATIADPATCQLTGIPTALQEEPITYTITATNSGGTSRAAISITVNDNIPELVNPNPRIYTINTPIAAVDFDNAGGAVTSCDVAPQLIGGLQLATIADPATCQLTGIPTTLQEDAITYTITATNSGGTSSADISITVNDNIPELATPSPQHYTIDTAIAAVDFGNTGGAVTSCEVGGDNSAAWPDGLTLKKTTDGASCQITGTPTALHEEEATYTITATNSGGTSSAAITITVNDNIPALVSPSPQHYTIDTAIAAVDFGNTGGAVTSCEVGGDNSAAWPDGLTLKKTTDGASCQLTGTPTALHEEEATYTITASNSGGTSSADISITVNDNIPELVSPSPQHYTIDTAIPAVNFSNTGGAVTSCEVGGDNSAAWPDGLTLKKTPDGASCQITGTPTALHEDATTYTITATNSGGTSSADISITVNDNIPELVSPSPQHYTIDTAIPTVNFSNTGGAVTSCEVGGDNSAAWPDGLTLKKTPDGASCQITGIPITLQEDPITYTITATNSGGTDIAAISITVNDAQPNLISPPPQLFTINTAIPTVNFVNFGGDVTSCDVSPQLVGDLQLATIADPATCQLTGIPTTLQEDAITYTITATNSGGDSSADISITVNDNIPELVNPSPRIYTINTPIAAVDFGNTGGAVTSCDVAPQLIGGLQLATIADPATCQLTGMPTTLQEDSITYTITATNSGGDSSADISITVNDNIPELATPSPRIYTINTPIAAVDFGNTGGAVTSCGVVPPLVGGLQLATIADPATCQLTGTPIVLQEDPITYTITATNSGGTSSADISITVNDNIPALVNPSPRIYTINTAIAAVDFSNTGGAVTSCNVSAPLPSGLQLATIADPATCQLTGIPTTLQEDAITYTITATNSGGTSSADISITVNDNIPALVSPSPQHYTIDTAIPTVNFSNTGGAVTSCEVGGDNSAAWPDGLTLKKTPDGASCQITGTPTALHEEEATYTITATNSGGTSSADISITVNDNIPALVSPSPQHYTIDTAIAAVDFGNTGGAVTSCEVGGDNSAAWPDGLTLKKTTDGASCQITGTPTALHEEEATYTITATNSGGTSSADISITVNDNIPALVNPSPRIYTINTPIAAVDFGNTGGAVTSCDVSTPLPSGLQLATIADPATCQLTGIPTTLQEDAITYTITATNSGGTSSADISITVNDNIPALATPSPQHYTIDTAIPTVNFSNTGGAVTSCEVGGDNSAAWPDGLTLKKTPDGASCQITGTPTALHEEEATYTITASNSGGTSSADISITVNDNIPALATPSPRIYTINTAIAAVDFGNTGGAVTSCEVGGDNSAAWPDGLTLKKTPDGASCQITGTPTALHEEEATYTITASNSGGTSSAAISITVNDNIPALVSPSPQHYTIDTAIAAVDFGNTGGAVTSCGVVPPLVGGLQLATIADPATCQLTGTPTVLQEEPITYTITATNSGGTSSAAISITVNDNIPALVSPSPQHYTIDTAIAAVDFGNTGGAVTSCGVVPPLVGGLQLATIADPATCQLTGIPTTLQEDAITYTITATNSGGDSSADISITVNDNIPELVNPSPRIYTINTPIAAVDFGNTGGAVTSCDVAPQLIGGLQLATIADPATCQLTGTPTTLQEDAITYTITATNSGGTSSAAISITVNDNIPELVNPSPRIYTINTPIAAVDFGNTGGAVTSCGVAPPLVGGLQLATIADPATCQLTGIPTALQEEPITYTITATNSGGTSSADISITVNDNIPALATPSPRIYTINTPIAAVDFGNTGGAVTSCDVSAPLPSGLQLATIADPATCQLTGTPTVLQEDPITYTITATNSGGTSSADISITVNDNIPALVNPSPRIYTINTPIAAVDFGNTGGAVTSCEVGGDNSAAWPDGLTLKKTPDGASCQITGTPTALHEEEATYTITATNSGGTSSAAISITVNDNIPALATPSPRIYTINTPIAAVDFGNTGGAVTSCGVVPPLVGGLQLATIADPATCQLTGTPTVLQEEPITYTITATNSGGTSSAAISITVNDNIPELASPSPQHYTIDTAIAAVDFGNTGGAVTSCEVGGDNSAAWPDGLTLKKTPDGASCQITGTPTTLQEDPITYTITASNSGGTSSADISITVNYDIPPILGRLADQYYIIGIPIQAVNFLNFGGDVISCDIAPQLAGGLQLAVATFLGKATCQITGTPTVPQEYEIMYTIKGSNSGGESRATVLIEIYENPFSGRSYASNPQRSARSARSARIEPQRRSRSRRSIALRDSITVNDQTPNDQTANDQAPALLYNNTAMVFVVSDRIPQHIIIENNGGDVTSCTPTPPLPPGLALNIAVGGNGRSTCQIDGSPNNVSATQTSNYVITGSNSAGDSSADVLITAIYALPQMDDKIAQTMLTYQNQQQWQFVNTVEIVRCSIAPPLPAGLTLVVANDSCAIQGSPTIVASKAEYVVSGYVSNVVDFPVSTATIFMTAVNSNCDTDTLVSLPDSNPLEKYQWYLDGRQQGQIATGMDASKMDSSIHLNLQRAWRTDGCLGQGTLVSVVDTGLQITHPDLADNIDPRQGYAFATGSFMQPNAATGTTDPSPRGSDGDHGTAIAGLIAMADNGMGGLGVAPKAKLLGFNNMAAGVNSNATYLQYSVGDGDPSATDSPAVDADIVYLGDQLASRLDHIGTPATAAIGSNAIIMRRIQDGRNGKGVIFIKPAGDSYIGDGDACSQANVIGTSCGLAGFDKEDILPIITVGAVNAFGKRASYAAAGAIWVSGFGGEQGSPSAGEPGMLAGEPGMFTTDVTSCSRGYSNHELADNAASNVLANQFHHDDPTCNYTNTFHGTRAAAAIVSGAVALLLSQHPALTIWDVRYILAKTATIIDADYTVTTDIPSSGAYQFSRGWITNAAGLNYSDWYGFGLVNVDAALAMAKSYSQLISHDRIEAITKNHTFVPMLVPNKNSDGVSKELYVAATGKIDHLNLFVKLTTTALQDIEISLTSPAGTSYPAYPAGNGHTQANLGYQQPIAVHAFLGESIQGHWRITVKDLFAAGDFVADDNTDYADSHDDTFSQWQLVIKYHQD